MIGKTSVFGLFANEPICLAKSTNIFFSLSLSHAVYYLNSNFSGIKWIRACPYTIIPRVIPYLKSLVRLVNISRILIPFAIGTRRVSGLPATRVSLVSLNSMSVELSFSRGSSLAPREFPQGEAFYYTGSATHFVSSRSLGGSKSHEWFSTLSAPGSYSSSYSHLLNSLAEPPPGLHD